MDIYIPTIIALFLKVFISVNKTFLIWAFCYRITHFIYFLWLGSKSLFVLAYILILWMRVCSEIFLLDKFEARFNLYDRRFAVAACASGVNISRTVTAIPLSTDPHRSFRPFAGTPHTSSTRPETIQCWISWEILWLKKNREMQPEITNY